MSLIKPEDKEMIIKGVLLAKYYIDNPNLDKLMTQVEKIELKKECQSCKHWDMGCALAGGKVPPRDVQENGCKVWEWSKVPF